MNYSKCTESVSLFIHRLSAPALLSGLALMSAPAQALIIDNFEQGGFSLVADQVNDPISIETGLPTSDVLGGARWAQVVQNGGIGTVGITLNTGSPGDDGVYIDTVATPDANPSVSGYLQLTYGGGLALHADLTADGGSSFLVTVGAATQSTTLGIALYSQIGSSMFGQYISRTIAAPGTYAFAFSDFSAVPNALKDVVRLDLFIGNTTVMDEALYSLLDFRTDGEEIETTVPEPGVIPLVGLGAVGMALSRRRRPRAFRLC
ncbi:PEP-CTERM sorting domain-containing protein [Methylocaldum sp.]|uniref:PEP-CTERM sorting domain-containing protein n=1 Tax=Methylocaldum sp. TaxID=1969727 RepID=UPI002D3D4C8F|nr:PEP-CTERM sorting domain-containing protein [Methylocaldum sp.]HYE38079.1 PEP-CTERM sorting domain-containing protein [Methylocaldum sp.]